MNAWHGIAAACREQHATFRAALVEPRAAQEALLDSILQANADCDAGRRFGFADLQGPADFRSAVPIHDYAAIAAEVDRMADGEPARLTRAAPSAFELTSGSGSAAKRVPYTADGLAGFQRALEPWLFDLIGSRPGIALGRAYWAISPVGRGPRVTTGGVPIGMDDSEYFGPVLGPLFTELLAVPPTLAAMTDIAAWRYRLLRSLLDADDLSFISVWSPTFLLALLDTLREEGERLAYDLARGTTTWPTADPSAPRARFAPRPRRARALRRMLSRPQPDLTALWPRLDTLSCWTHATAARFRVELEHCLPGVRVQGKGLLATEAAVSVPLEEFEYPVLAVNSTFVEFIDDAGRSHLAHEVERGGTYRVVVTTASGLYRYDLADRVKVHGLAGRTPTMEFVGRTGLVSDLCGEKLTDDFVMAAIAEVDGFALLAHNPDTPAGYVLLLDAARHGPGPAARITARVEERLRANPQYDHARQIGQLAPLASARVRNPVAGLTALARDRARRIGDIKPVALSPSVRWVDHFVRASCPSQAAP